MLLHMLGYSVPAVWLGDAEQCFSSISPAGMDFFLSVGLDNGETAASLRLDVLFPVNGYKRYISGGAYEFLYPQSWLEDVTLYRQRIERAEFQRGVEFKQLEDMERVAKRESVVQPAVGFGPPAGGGQENLSVVAAPSPGLVYALSTTIFNLIDVHASAPAAYAIKFDAD